MDYTNFFDQTLENERARLEPLEEKHFDVLWPVAEKKEIWKFTTAVVESVDDFKRYFNTALDEKKRKLSCPFAVFDKEAGQYAGCTRFGNISFDNKRIEIGWTWYDPLFQGTGLNKSCKYLLLSYGFDKWDLNRIELKTSHLNLRSQNAMLKIGATKEGTLRRYTIGENGFVRDTVYFSFIKEEWEEVRKRIFEEFL